MEVKNIIFGLGYREDEIGEYGFCRSEVGKIIMRNQKVIAFTKNCMGAIVILKGKKKNFGFCILSKGIDCGGFSYKMSRMDLKQGIKMIESENPKILDKEELEKTKDKLMIEAI